MHLYFPVFTTYKFSQPSHLRIEMHGYVHMHGYESTDMDTYCKQNMDTCLYVIDCRCIKIFLYVYLQVCIRGT